MFIDIRKYITEEDYKLLKDKKRNKELLERNRQLVKKAKKGDLQARNYLFLLNSPIIINVITKSFSIDLNDVLEYLNMSFEYFIEAVEEFNVKRNDNFIVPLKNKIRTRLLNEIGNKKQKKKRDNTYCIDNKDDSNEDVYEHCLAHIDTSFDRLDIHLTEEEKSIKDAYFINKEKMLNISKRLNIPYQKVRKIKAKIIEKEKL